MRSCLRAQPMRHSYTQRDSNVTIKHSAAVNSRRRLLAVPSITQQQQLRSMNLVASALPALNAALAGLSVGLFAAWLDAKLKSRKPDIYCTPNEFNSAVLDRCPTMQSTYNCTPFLTNGHVETIMVAKLRKPPGVVYKREFVLTKDGGAVAIDWEHFGDDGKDLPAEAPVLILFPGLTGGSEDSYVQHAVLQARHAGVRAAVFNSRGTADSPVLTPQFYSASFTEDTREVIAHVQQRFPASRLYAAGWSLGANILVNYLGEQGPDTPLEAAISMCNPFDLTISNRHINEGFNKIYNWNLANSLKRIFLKHQPLWRSYQGPGQPELVPQVTTIREFDEAITVHSFDWEDVDAYYAGSSSAKRIPKVAIPLLCIQAADDPIAPEEAIPYEAIKQNPNCTLVVTPCGGHLGWAAGSGAPFGEPWTDAAVVEWLTSVHMQLQQQKAASAGLTAAQQQQQAAQTTSSSSPPPRLPREDHDDDGNDNGDDSNGGGGGGGDVTSPHDNGTDGGRTGVLRELETAAVSGGGRANSVGSTLTITTTVPSRLSSDSAGTSRSFISPISSPASSYAGTSRAVTPASSVASSVVGSNTNSIQIPARSKHQQHRGRSTHAVVTNHEGEPALLMEQLWWGQGTTRAGLKALAAQQQHHQQQQQHLSRYPADRDAQYQRMGGQGSAVATEQSVVQQLEQRLVGATPQATTTVRPQGLSLTSLAAGTALPNMAPQQQQAAQVHAPSTDAGGVVAAAPVQPAADDLQGDVGQTSTAEETVMLAAAAVVTTEAVASGTAPADEGRLPTAVPADALGNDRVPISRPAAAAAAAAAVDEVEMQLWHSVRWAF